ncbi:Putative sperm motility kinase W [Lemmus lemmus]
MPVIIKVVNNRKKRLYFITQEIMILEKVQHPHIIRLFQVEVTTKYCHLIMEYAPGGNLYQLVKEKDRLQEEEAQKIFGQLVSAIKCCHDHGIMHRNLRPQNILFDTKGNVKLADFGLATTRNLGDLVIATIVAQELCAPERVLSEIYDGMKAEVWSLGVLLYFMTTGHHPFTGSIREKIKEIINGKYDIPAHMSGQLENLIHQILTVAPERRPSTEDILQHPWVKNPEVSSHCEPYPDPKIIDMLLSHGYAAENIFDSLRCRKYDEIMGAYLLYQEQAHQGLDSASVKPVNPGPAPPPSPVPPSPSGRHLERSSSQSTFGLLHTQPSQQHTPDVPTGSGQKMTRRAFMPLLSPQNKSPTSSSAPLTKAASTPCVCCSMVEEKVPLPPGPDPNMETSSAKNTGCFGRLGRAIRACLSKLCCFRRAPKSQTRRFNNKVAPLREAGGRPRK